MIMKLNKILTMAAGVVLACSCSDLLEKKPLVDLAVENYYTSEAEVNTAMLGIYHVFMTENFGLYHYLHIGDNMSDDSQLGNSRSDGAAWAGAAKSLVKYDILPTNGYAANNTWNQDFLVVTNANYLIEKATKSEVPNLDRYIAEAKFLRSYVYFDMTRQFGGLQLVDHVLSHEEYYMPRSSEEETWAFVEQGFIDAIAGLPEEWDAANIGRATKGAAMAMLARAYVYHASFAKKNNLGSEQGLWQKAYDTIKELDSKHYFHLEPNYADVFSMENQNGPEIVFSIQFRTSHTGWGDSNDGNMMAFYGHDAGIKTEDLVESKTTLDPDTFHFVYNKMLEEFPSRVNEDGTPMPYAKKWTGWSLHCPTLDLVNAFEPGDPRLASTVIAPNEFYDGHTHFNLSSDTRYQTKKEYVPFEWRTEESNEDDMPRNMIILRYSNILLYMAEACNELGKPAEALAYLKQVRDRARNSGDDPTVLPEVTTTDQTELREAIFHERRVELALEYDRFWDLARTGRLYSVMHAYYQNYGDDISHAKKGELVAADGHHEHLPIPQSAIDASFYNGEKTLSQNPGY